jgi:hypothetical protein
MVLFLVFWSAQHFAITSVCLYDWHLAVDPSYYSPATALTIVLEK